MVPRLPIVKLILRGVPSVWFVDERLQELREIENPHSVLTMHDAMLLATFGILTEISNTEEGR